jgi:putative glutamine amidotransferase
MRPPLIGITTGYEQHGETVAALAWRYIHAVERAGGVPVCLAPVQEPHLLTGYAERLDGLIVSGGKDIPPTLYGEQPHPQTDAMTEDRPLFEMQLVRRFLERNKPVLGICYGCQLLNVAFGGSLIQDIPSQIGNGVKHRRDSPQEPHARHRVAIPENSRLRKILGMSELEIVSSHHQAVKEPAAALKVVALAPDGVIEAVEMEDVRFLIGVQWHPEMDLEAEATHRLMGAFVEAASGKNEP